MGVTRALLTIKTVGGDTIYINDADQAASFLERIGAAASSHLGITNGNQNDQSCLHQSPELCASCDALARRLECLESKQADLALKAQIDELGLQMDRLVGLIAQAPWITSIVSTSCLPRTLSLLALRFTNLLVINVVCLVAQPSRPQRPILPTTSLSMTCQLV